MNNELIELAYQQGRKDAIDEFAEKVFNHVKCEITNGCCGDCRDCKSWLFDIADEINGDN